MRVGVLGRGFMGRTHLKALAEIADVELSADTDIAKVIDDPRVDAVDICLPTNLHAPVALEALRAGKHVLVEKPMALDVAASWQMIARAKKQKRVLMVAHVLRFFPMYVALGDILASGRIGAPRSAMFRRRCGAPAWGAWLTDPEQSGGGVFDLLIHDMDLCLHLFGKPETVTATGYEALADGVDVITAELHYAGGLAAVITGGWHHPKAYPFSMEYTVVAEKGTVEYSSLGCAPTLYRGDGEIELLAMTEQDGYRAEIEYFLDCCRRGENPALCPPEESAAAVALALCILEARKRNGQRIRCQL
ncbi:MAG TPA: Gfo/Idh/MocA family oxidoreductase [Bryobacteraceae bacterium]|nr:Gfo/Idh/MocA family oxidoreductase [Bryobacteraceae bacterium]